MKTSADIVRENGENVVEFLRVSFPSLSLYFFSGMTVLAAHDKVYKIVIAPIWKLISNVSSNMVREADAEEA